MPSSASVSTVLVRPLVAALAALPGGLDRFWRATDLTPEMVADADARISPAQFCVAWSEATRLTGDPALALRIAEATPAGAFGVVEYVCRSAATLGDALRQWVRYLGILDDSVEVGLVDLPSGKALRVIAESEAPAPGAHELCFALVVLHARRMTAGRFHSASARFTHRAPEPHASRYRALFGNDVHFARSRTELVFTSGDLETPLVTADPTLLAILLPTAEAKREQKGAEASVTGQVRRALRAALCNDDAAVASVARRLGLTARSLQRRLEDEGTSFQILRDETRRTLAERYLADTHSLAEISFLLGFSEPSAFFRAFKRWTGLTPIERRASLRATGNA